MANAQDNPFFKPWNTPHGTAPFTDIKDEHYKAAGQHGIELANKEMNALPSRLHVHRRGPREDVRRPRPRARR